MERETYKHHYPELSEEGIEKTQQIINTFRKQLEDIVNDTLVKFTCNIGAEITSDDSWIDLRQKMTDALCGYGEEERKQKQSGTYLGQWWVKIRAKILEENRDAIINDIILDKEAEIANLKSQIISLQRNYKM